MVVRPSEDGALSQWQAFVAVIEFAISVDLSRLLSQSKPIITERDGHLVGSAVFKTVVGK